MKALAGVILALKCPCSSPGPLQALCKSCKSLTTHRPGGATAGAFMSGGFMRQAPQFLPGASPQPVKIPPHKSWLPP